MSSNPNQEQWQSAFRGAEDVLEPETNASMGNYYDPSNIPFGHTPVLQRSTSASEAPPALNRQDDSEWGLKYLAGLTEVLRAREEYHSVLLKFYNFEKRFDPNACICELWRRAHESFQDIAIDLDTAVYNINHER